MRKTFEIYAFDEDLVVECNYFPADIGDYMYPGHSAEIEIVKISLYEGGDVTDLILQFIDDAENTIKEKIFEQL